MAKKKFNISGTLNKNQAPKLAEKIPLKKTTKDIEIVKEKVEEIHKEEPKPQSAIVSKQKKVKSTPGKVTGKEEVVKEKLVRMTIDTPESMHKALKIKSIERGISLRDYILKLIVKELK